MGNFLGRALATPGLMGHCSLLSDPDHFDQVTHTTCPVAWQMSAPTMKTWYKSPPKAPGAAKRKRTPAAGESSLFTQWFLWFQLKKSLKSKPGSLSGDGAQGAGELQATLKEPRPLFLTFNSVSRWSWWSEQVQGSSFCYLLMCPWAKNNEEVQKRV